MAPEAFKCKLSAILNADEVGYSRLMGALSQCVQRCPAIDILLTPKIMSAIPQIGKSKYLSLTEGAYDVGSPYCCREKQFSIN
jgi:hypothetical protein